MADGLIWPVSQPSAAKPALPMGIITSYVIVVGAQDLYCLRQHTLGEGPDIRTDNWLWSNGSYRFSIYNMGRGSSLIMVDNLSQSYLLYFNLRLVVLPPLPSSSLFSY
ncbi:hypothetical protein ElyMa_004126000 [Elysia marginata]|uniref:Uncharacterized protein n=1 Tax=Elysia marginata TaxID=1093978 RepID=A0AAV4GGK9_9GAST|nr:hypothetical protein ElyMa_004126000 [Elysia marginata]